MFVSVQLQPLEGRARLQTNILKWPESDQSLCASHFLFYMNAVTDGAKTFFGSIKKAKIKFK